MFFHIPHNVFKLITMCAYDHRDMAGHDAISIYFKPFELLAMFPAVNDDVTHPGANVAQRPKKVAFSCLRGAIYPQKLAARRRCKRNTGQE